MIEKSNCNSRADTRIRALVLISAVLLSTMAGLGCAAGQYGGLRPDTNVTEMFTNNNVPDDYQYYINGRSDMPYAIIGIAPRYELVTRVWEPVEPDTPHFETRVDLIWDPHVWYQYDPAKGAWILDPEGNRIGIWYSMYPRAKVVVENRKVRIFPPVRINEP